MAENSSITLHVKGAKGAAIEVVLDGQVAGRTEIPAGSDGFADVMIPLGNAAGEHDLTLRLAGRVILDWFRIG